jgi:GTPase
VERFWERVDAVGVRIETSILTQGDRIAFEQPVEFEEQGVQSLQVNNNPVSQVEAGMLVGIQTSLRKEQLKKGTRVYRLRQL